MERKRSKVRERAERQAGRIALFQFLAAEWTRQEVRSWLARGLLIPCLPKVYALGHRGGGLEAALWEAILYAGPGAELSHDSGAHNRGYIDYPPPEIHVSTPRAIKSLPGIVVHGRRTGLERHIVRGLPTTGPEQTALDVAARHDGEAKILRRMLSQMDYLGQYDPGALYAVTGPGIPGSRSLKRAMLLHNPSLARSNSQLEEDLYALLESWNFQPLPDLINEEIAPGLRPDAAYSRYRVAIETDGRANHSSPAQLTRDRSQELAYRATGYILLRYSWAQIHADPKAVHDDLLAALDRAAIEHGLPRPRSGLRIRT